MFTDYAQNKITDAIRRSQPLGAPATLYLGLITASRGLRANSTAYALNDTMVALVGGKYAFYKCTTAGSSASAQPGTYLGAVGEAITDGTAVFTEQTAAIEAGQFVEVSGGSYARASVAASLANFAGTQGAGTTVASTGTGGLSSNNAPITWPAPTAQWHPTNGQIVGIVEFDAATGGNAWTYMLIQPKSVNAGDPAPSAAAGTLTWKIGN
jgi:hypothetical protein